MYDEADSGSWVQSPTERRMTDREAHPAQTPALPRRTVARVVRRNAVFIGGISQIPMMRLTTQNMTAETSAAAGSVRNQAITMFPATPQRTAEKRLVEPTPMIEALTV